MSGYFDALMRSSGMTIGRPELAPTPLEPAAIGGEVDRSTSAEAKAERSASTPHEPHAPLHTADAMEPPMPPRVLGSVDRHTYQEPDTAPTPAHGAAEKAVHSPKKPSAPPVESLTPDLGHTLVRAAMRWVAAGTPQDSPVSAVRDVAQGVPDRRSHRRPLRAKTDHRDERPHRDDDDAHSESRMRRGQHPHPESRGKESVAAKPLPIERARRSCTAAASCRGTKSPRSRSAQSMRVDAPPAQTIARPAPTRRAHARRRRDQAAKRLVAPGTAQDLAGVSTESHAITPRLQPQFPGRSDRASGFAIRRYGPLAMSLADSGTAIGAVTRLLQDHLLRRSFQVSIGKPEDAADADPTASKLNLFLYETAFDPHLRNVSLRDGELPPLWLVLKFLLTAFDTAESSDTAAAHDLLGRGISALHELNFLRLDPAVATDVRRALENNPEPLKVTFDESNLDVLSKIMQGNDERYRCRSRSRCAR